MEMEMGKCKNNVMNKLEIISNGEGDGSADGSGYGSGRGFGGVR